MPGYFGDYDFSGFAEDLDWPAEFGVYFYAIMCPIFLDKEVQRRDIGRDYGIAVIRANTGRLIDAGIIFYYDSIMARGIKQCGG